MEAKKVKSNNRNKVLDYYLVLVGFIFMLSLTGTANIMFAQGQSENEQQAAIIQYTLKYRFGQDLKVGDWVKYNEITEEGANTQEIELNVSNEEKDGIWIVEKSFGTEVHYLVDLKQMKLLQAIITDDEGKKIEITPLSDEKLAEVTTMFKNQMEQQGSFAQFISWIKGEETKKIDVPAGSFTCVYIKPEYSEQQAIQMQNYVKQMKEQGTSEAEIDAEISKNEPRLYFSKDVPRLLPVQIAMGWMPWIESFEEIEGGLVECKHMSPLRLNSFSGQ